eukprot:6129261-Prymnesium_polylepis.1
MKYVAVGSERTACNVPHHIAIDPPSRLRRTKDSPTAHSCLGDCDYGSWRASSILMHNGCYATAVSPPNADALCSTPARFRGLTRSRSTEPSMLA